uniref:non-specific serine/threonine protein kinase n=1 Tax=Meloidogyne enterolobii TaxID=390850 RepID=A0A6V7TVQ5_MELEN|nr:unnamed protein product [Meloidogyne enterolobii]
MNPQNEQLNNYFYNQHQSSPYLVPTTSIYDFYSLINIGSGAFAQVYKGYELINLMPAKYREVALKRINLAAITDPAIYKTTINEVNIFTRLNHQNIVKCFRSFEEISRYSQNKYLVLVLEYVNGGDLQTLIQERATTYSCLLHESEIWFLFGQIAGAVKYIHSKRIIHRDLKPPNVLLTDNGIVKLADFGLSRLNLPVGYQAQTVCGTPYYMSPERIIEEPYTFASDIWSLGCILYEQQNHHFFGEKDNVESLIHKIQTADYPPIPDDRYTPQLEFLIESCMRPVMNERPNAVTVYEVAQYMNGLWGNH